MLFRVIGKNSIEKHRIPLTLFFLSIVVIECTNSMKFVRNRNSLNESNVVNLNIK